MKNKKRKGFTIVFNSFIDTPKLSQHDKMVFISIKSFANKEGKAWPSLTTISRLSGVSISQVRRCIKKMQDMGVIKVEPRTNSYNFGRISNLYHLYDSEEMWDFDEQSAIRDDYIAFVRECPDDILEEEFKRRQKERRSISGTGENTDQDPAKNSYSLDNNHNTDKSGNQEMYTMKFIKDRYDYEVMIYDYPEYVGEIDYILKIIYDTLNSSQETIRVQQTERPRDIVISQLMKLDYSKIIYVIQKYREQTGRVSNPQNYILTQLYNAVGQMEADILNQVNHDLYGKKMTT